MVFCISCQLNSDVWVLSSELQVNRYGREIHQYQFYRCVILCIQEVQNRISYYSLRDIEDYLQLDYENLRQSFQANDCKQINDLFARECMEALISRSAQIDNTYWCVKVNIQIPSLASLPPSYTTRLPQSKGQIVSFVMTLALLLDFGLR